MKIVTLSKLSSPDVEVNIRYCDSFFCKLKGLMFTRELDPDEGIMFVENGESKVNTSIHMFFMRYDLAVLWLDNDRVIVDKVLAKKWAPFYIPQKAAQYVVELHPSKFAEFEIGDQLVFGGEG